MTKTEASVTMAEEEDHALAQNKDQDQDRYKSTSRRNYMILLAINYMCLFIGSVSSSLLSKFYFIHKGSSKWVSTLVQSAGFPILLLPVFLPFYLFKSTVRKPFTGFSRKVISLSILIGFFLGVNNFLFSWGTAYLPVSTSSLLLSSQLAFTLLFSIIIVKQKITFQNINCVFLLTLSSLMLALAGHDKGNETTREKYLIGLFSTIGAGLLFSLYCPLMEMIYRDVNCYAMVMEMQLVMEVAATLLATVGMAASGGFKEMKNESLRVFDKGQDAYWWTVGITMVTWQMCFMGTAGLLFLTTSMTGAICMTALTGMNIIGGVIVYGDKFGVVKVMSTLLCGWGFFSYIYGMYLVNIKQHKQKTRIVV